MGHPNSKKHKASHCGYKQKPTKQAVNSLMELYAGIQIDTYKFTMNTSIQPRPGEQLSLF